MNQSFFKFQNSYVNLGEGFYSKVLPVPVGDPKGVKINVPLLASLGISYNQKDESEWVQILAGNKIPAGADPLAMAYAGHQFGHFAMLGDGRALLMGEHITPDGRRLDIQWKGSGPTPYSRRGDGRATLSAMLREYLISESMYGLGIKTSRCLAVIGTGEKVYREQAHAGAVLTRVMESHIRVGTFEYVNHFLGVEALTKMVDYVIQRLYPDLHTESNKPLALLEKVCSVQIDLVLEWMRVGFIHGVMNTDNMSISGETFDYGPCAFMNVYDPATVYSSIDRQGRYAFGNQASIAQWNLVCLANALIPVIHTNEDKAVTLARQVIDGYPDLFAQRWLNMMAAKLGVESPEEKDRKWMHQLLDWMKANKADYTDTFRKLSTNPDALTAMNKEDGMIAWRQTWYNRLEAQPGGIQAAQQKMLLQNPAHIPRNHWVEKALLAAVQQDDYALFDELWSMMQTPYQEGDYAANTIDSSEEFEVSYRTFCGT